MADKTKIEWTEATWNPITGCSVVSPGCTNCYAMKLAGTRMQHHPSRAGLTRDSKAGPVWTGEVRFNEQWLDQPLRWKRPRLIFVCAHGDLFHENVPDAWIDRVFAVMALAPQHTFQVLTKRAERMRAWFATGHQTWGRVETVRRQLCGFDGYRGETPPWPLPNVWLGVSVEDEDQAADRLPWLLDTPAAIRWMSGEPLLGDIDLTCVRTVGGLLGSVDLDATTGEIFWAGAHTYRDSIAARKGRTGKLDWIVVGGESGPGARPMHPDWARNLRDQADRANIPFFFKQWGDWIPEVGAVDGWALGDDPEISRFEYRDWEGDHWGHPYSKAWCDDVDDDTVSRVGKKAAGALLDGVEWRQMPERR